MNWEFDYEVVVKNGQPLCHLLITKEGENDISDIVSAGELNCFLNIMEQYFDDDAIFNFVTMIRKDGVLL